MRTPRAQVVEADQPLWNIKDLAQFLGMSMRWIHERTRRNEIPCYRLGTALRFEPEEIRRWVAQYHHNTNGSGETR